MQNTGPVVPIHKLDFVLSPEIVQSIQKAEENFAKFAGTTSTPLKMVLLLF